MSTTGDAIMKAIALILLFIATTGFSDEQERNGVWWAQFSQEQKYMWAVGWSDGLQASERITGKGSMKAASDRFNNLTSCEIVTGIDQFYAADFRNLKIDVSDVALLSAMAATGLSNHQAMGMTLMLREVYR